MAELVVMRFRRRALRRERVFRDRSNPLEMYDETELFRFFRFGRAGILSLHDEIRDEVEFAVPRKGCLSALMQLLMTLRFLATGCFQNIVASAFGVDQATASRAISRVTNCFAGRLGRFVKLPSQEEANVTKAKFFNKTGFPNVIGCIDGTHIRILAPSQNEHEFVNRKNYHSINVQLMCDADLKFINCVAKWPGSVHDARILRESALFRDFDSPNKPLTGVILGDSGYMQRDWLFTPVLHIRNAADERYNKAQSSTRSTIERCIGVLKRRWHCLHAELRVSPEQACKIVCACVVLHNWATVNDIPVPDDGDDDIPEEDDQDDTSSRSNNSRSISERARSAAGKAARDALIQNVFNV